jgi:CDP-4-dehydro-6-deoxyglucose reductase
MVDTLPLSRAARAAGVSRAELQAKIEAGELDSFEGMVRLDDLVRVFPPAQPQESAQLRRMRQIKDAALSKPMPDDSPSEFASLRVTVNHLQVELAAARAQVETYRALIDSLTDRLIAVQDGCDERQRLMLQAVLSWLMGQLKRTR